MYIQLINCRLENCYYRSKTALLNDVQAIAAASEIYNRENGDLSEFARKLALRIKNALSLKINGFNTALNPRRVG